MVNRLLATLLIALILYWGLRQLAQSFRKTELGRQVSLLNRLLQQLYGGERPSSSQGELVRCPRCNAYYPRGSDHDCTTTP